MRLNPIEPVQAVVCSDGWPEGVRHEVLASLRGQVTTIREGFDIPDGRAAAVLLVAAPVLFARGAVGEIARAASVPGRVVTRVLVPGEEPTSVALWSGTWLSRHDVELPHVIQDGLTFDRDHLPHDDPYARAWVRADELGVARYWGHESSALRWAWFEGARLLGHRLTTPLRGALGRVRRMRSLAGQRRRHSRRR